MLARLLTVFGLLVATLSSKAALAWEPVRWPSSVCDPIDPVAADDLVYAYTGLENYVRPSWLQCPIRTVPGLRPDEFVEWTAELYAPADLPCLLRVVSEQGELLATTSLTTPEPGTWFSPPSAMTFSWQPANADLYGVGETTAVVRCGLSISGFNEWPRVALKSVVAPGDRDIERHYWPGTMCKPMEDLDASERPKGTDGILYNSGGAIANMSTRFERWVVCPVPVPASRKGTLTWVHWEARVLNDAEKHFEMRGYDFSQGSGWSASQQPEPGRFVFLGAEVNHALTETINVYYWLAKNGPLGPAGIASFLVDLEYGPDPPTEQ